MQRVISFQKANRNAPKFTTESIEEKTKINVPKVPMPTDMRRTESVVYFLGTKPAIIAPKVYPSPTKPKELLATSLDTLRTDVRYKG